MCAWQGTEECKNQAFIQAPLMIDLISVQLLFLCTNVFVTWVNDIYPNTKKCFLRTFVLKSWNEFSSSVYFSRCPYTKSEYFSTFFFLKLCELRKVLQRKFLPFRQGFNYKAHDDGSCGFWGDVSCQCNPLHYSEHTKIIALILSLCKCDPCWPSSQTVCFQKYPEKHQK